jgi:disulfide bond formation protein DsbB
VEQQWWPGTASCGAANTPNSLQALMAQLKAQPIIRCDEVAWSLLGLSMAAYNLVFSMSLGGLILTAAGRLELRRFNDEC